MAKVLGRVTAAADRPRGPDAELKLRVPEAWFESGATLEIELPRNLACATCGGGGCDRCRRSGAVSLRGRDEAPEVIEVTVPRQDGASSGTRALLLRIPDRGGLPEQSSELPRGNLMLRVEAGLEPDAGVARIRHSVLTSAPPSVAGWVRTVFWGNSPRAALRLVVFGVLVASAVYWLSTLFSP